MYVHVHNVLKSCTVVASYLACMGSQAFPVGKQKTKHSVSWCALRAECCKTICTLAIHVYLIGFASNGIHSMHINCIHYNLLFETGVAASASLSIHKATNLLLNGFCAVQVPEHGSIVT